jgi:hypothetical protein
MRKTKYSFSNLRRHSKDIRLKTTMLIREKTIKINEAFFQFDDYVTELERTPPSLIRNVKLLLSCQMINHVYSGLILVENGMIVDTILCERNALETMALHWLVCLDPNVAEEYEKDEIPRPVEVRKRLEQLGIDISSLKNFYSFGSQISHTGRKSERFTTDLSSSKKGELIIGGAYSPIDQSELLEWLPSLLVWFLTYCK